MSDKVLSCALNKAQVMIRIWYNIATADSKSFIKMNEYIFDFFFSQSNAFALKTINMCPNHFSNNHKKFQTAPLEMASFPEIYIPQFHRVSQLGYLHIVKVSTRSFSYFVGKYGLKAWLGSHSNRVWLSP